MGRQIHLLNPEPMTHKLIHTKDYLLVVDDSEIKEKEYCINLQDKGNNIFPFMDMRYIGIDYNKKVIKKIIAHLPLNDSPILEGVDLLPPFFRHQEDGIEGLAHSEYRVSLQPIGRTLAGGKYDVDINYESRIGFINGYNKAKEKYKYTNEDMLTIRNNLVTLLPTGDVTAWDMIQAISKYTKWFDNYVESLSQPELPTAFECELYYNEETIASASGFSLKTEPIIKTTTTPEGHTQWMGKYIY